MDSLCEMNFMASKSVKLSLPELSLTSILTRLKPIFSVRVDRFRKCSGTQESNQEVTEVTCHVQLQESTYASPLKCTKYVTGRGPT